MQERVCDEIIDFNTDGYFWIQIIRCGKLLNKEGECPFHTREWYKRFNIILTIRNTEDKDIIRVKPEM